MFEITYDDRDLMRKYTESKLFPEGAEYDFTFERRFLIYHRPLRKVVRYVALDKTTGKTSAICERPADKLIQKREYKHMIAQILNSIKYTGDRRKICIQDVEPVKLIEEIFEAIMPEYGYAVREPQVELSKQMYMGLTDKRISICEAEVGTGKTMAYLVAALVAKKYGADYEGSLHPITVSTSSIELQSAIVEKEIPRLSQILLDYGLIDRPLTVVLRKGKEHYLCLGRFNSYVQQLEQYGVKYKNVLDFFEKTRFADRVLDLDRVKIPSAVKARICVKDSCKTCRLRGECRYNAFVYQAKEYRRLDFQVTNHNMYLVNQKLRESGEIPILQSSRFVVVDEAHKLRSTAEDVFGIQIEGSEIARYCQSVSHLRKKREDKEIYNKCLDDLQALWGQVCSSIQKDAYLTERDQSQIVKFGDTELDQLMRMIQKIKEIENSRRHPANLYDLSGVRLVEKLTAFLTPAEMNVWAEKDASGKLILCGTPKNIGDLLREMVWDKPVSHILTSGTMGDGNGFSFFKRENGINHVRAGLVQESATPSPFDYANHTRLYMPKGMPAPVVENEKYIQAVGRKIVDLVNATNGHTAILFTSYKELQKVYQEIENKLKKYDVICMTRNNKSAISEFKKSKNGILFAAGPMWEGVDCAGDGLSSVIIVRLPFPMRSAAMEQKKAEAESLEEFISKTVVPDMIIKLRQGVGRLIRTENDTGLITILDSRAQQSSYAMLVQDTLSKYPQVGSVREIKDFFKEVKPEAYYEM